MTLVDPTITLLMAKNYDQLLLHLSFTSSKCCLFWSCLSHIQVWSNGLESKACLDPLPCRTDSTIAETWFCWWRFEEIHRFDHSEFQFPVLISSVSLICVQHVLHTHLMMSFRFCWCCFIDIFFIELFQSAIIQWIGFLRTKRSWATLIKRCNRSPENPLQ